MKISPLRVRVLIQKEFRQLFRDPKTKRIIFAAPIIQLFLFGYAVNTDVRNVSTVVLDEDRTVESRLLQEALTASGYFRINDIASSPRDVEKALDRGSSFAQTTRMWRVEMVRVPVGGRRRRVAL